MSTAPLHPSRSGRNRRTESLRAIACAFAVFAATTCAQAKQSDKDQPININASSFAGSQDSGKIVFTGSVTLDQGTFKADGAQATGYTDPDDTSQWQRVVLVGSPAHFQQTQDSGALVHGQGDTIDYKVSENTVILTGNAVVVQQGKGEFHGEKLVYNTDTGEIQGSPIAGGRVHITLQPRTKPAGASATTSAPASAGPSASASSGTPASGSTPDPMPASTSGKP